MANPGEQVNERMLAELVEWLRIPSISSGGGQPADLERAAEWACAKVISSGGKAEVVATPLNPLVVGRLDASTPGAPTVLIYGHYDVQSADPIEAWTSPPFEPAIRDGRLYARGAADDKGNFFPLLYVACELAADGALPVNVRVLIEGEEEIAGRSVTDWVAADAEGADCAIVFDSDMLDESTPALTLGVRGIVAADLKVRTAPGDLHSGLYGGSVLNAVHVLHEILGAVMPGPDGRLREELREGIEPPSGTERKAWAELPSAEVLFEQIGARPIHPGSARDYYEQNWADASFDIHGISGGDAVQQRTIIPAAARARFSVRLASGQRSSVVAATLERLLREACPEGVELELWTQGDDPAVFDPDIPAMAKARIAIEKACGMPVALTRSGGSIPVLAAFERRGIPAIVSGFALPDDRFHAPNESYRLESLRLGEAAARALYEELATLGG